jgi:hypothetical protein
MSVLCLVFLGCVFSNSSGTTSVNFTRTPSQWRNPLGEICYSPRVEINHGRPRSGGVGTAEVRHGYSSALVAENSEPNTFFLEYKSSAISVKLIDNSQRVHNPPRRQ